MVARPDRAVLLFGPALLSMTLLLGVGVVIWRLFHPAIMSYDSVVQYRQAWVGHYADWHPPLMSLVLHLFLRLGRNIGALTLLVVLAGLFGIRAFAQGVAALWRDDLGPVAREGIAWAVLAVLLSPLSPLLFYLVHFWKDSWCAVVMVWIGAFAVGLLNGHALRPRLAAVLALAATLALLRHNAIVVLPAIGLVLWAATADRRRSLRLSLLVAPLLTFLIMQAVIDRAFEVEHVHLERHMMAFDLVGMCARRATVCDELVYLRPFLRVEEAAVRYVPGNMPVSFWTAPPLLDPGALWFGDRLRAEYWRLARRHPGLLAQVKLAAFTPLLGLDKDRLFFYFFGPKIAPNEYGLRINETHARARDLLARATHAVGFSPLLGLVSAVHLIWIVVAVLWGLGLSWRRSRLRLATVMLMPLGFYASYLFATPSPDYRFMYAATLFVQVFTLAAIAAWVWPRSRTAAAPI